MAESNDDKYGKRRSQKRQANAILILFVVICIGVTFLTRYHVFGSDETNPKIFQRQEAFIDSGDVSGVRKQTEPQQLRKKEKEKKSRGLNAQKKKEASINDPSLSDYALKKLVDQVESLDAEVRKIKGTGVIMEVDEESLVATKKLQDATRLLLAARYGKLEPYRVRLELEFQDTISDFAENGPDGEIVIELAPSNLVPHSIFSFLEIARHWKKGAFHRIAGHVLQVMVNKNPVKHLAFQEYSPQFPHKKGTVGYAGRPSGPAWYVSTQDNVRNHGPGSQQNHNPHEADSCFGKVVVGFDDVVQRIKKVDGKEFISDAKKHVLIKSMHILVPADNSENQFVEWIEPLF